MMEETKTAKQAQALRVRNQLIAVQTTIQSEPDLWFVGLASIYDEIGGLIDH